MAISFTPTGPTAAAAPLTPAAGSGIAFTPNGGTAQAPAAAPQSGGTGLGAFALNLINNNPVSRAVGSIAALPVQLGVKGINAVAGTHIPDPFANGAAGINITSSDQAPGQMAEQEAGNAATAGSLFFPAGKVAGVAAGALRPFIGAAAGPAARIGTNVALGTLQGIGGGMQDGQSGAQIKASAGTGALIGGGLAAAGELGGALLSNLASRTPESKLTAHIQGGGAAKTLQNSFDDNSTFRKDPATGQMVETSNPLQTLSSTGLIKGLKVVDGRINTESIDSGIADILASQDRHSAQLVENMPGTVKLSDLQAAAEDAVRTNPQIRDAGKVQVALKEVERRFGDLTESFGNEVPWKVVNGIRVAMNREYNPDTRDVARTIGDAARTMLYAKDTGSPELGALMTQQGQILKAQNFVDRLRGTTVRGGRLGKLFADLGAGIVGGMVGGAAGPIGSGVAGAASAAAADKIVGAYQKNYFNPLLAGPAKRFQSILSSPAAGAVSRVGQASLIPSAVQK